MFLYSFNTNECVITMIKLKELPHVSVKSYFLEIMITHFSQILPKKLSLISKRIHRFLKI